MKKIMFNDKYGLTKAVLEGRKTQTRRIANIAFYSLKNKEDVLVEDVFLENGAWYVRFKDVTHLMPKEYLPKYKIGEVVAIAQSYEAVSDNISIIPSKERADFYCKIMHHCYPKEEIPRDKNEIAGWTNKMFVKPELMPHQIRITNIRIEKLKDISDDDCLAEGITKIVSEDGTLRYYVKNGIGESLYATDSPQKAYSFLIDKVGKKGDWESKPWVWVYDFELIR